MHTQNNFREICHRHGLAATHQRQVIYQTIIGLTGHPSPEAIYDKVRRKIPSISLATVYKNIRIFLDSGMLREVSLHHGSMRVETNNHPHHHLVCVVCKSIADLDESELEPLRLDKNLPRGFQVKRIAVDVLGVCQTCSSTGARTKTKFRT